METELLLKIESDEYEVECGEWKPFGDMDCIARFAIGATCKTCMSSGIYKVKLEGIVTARALPFPPYPQYHLIALPTKPDWDYTPCSASDDTIKSVVDDIIQAYRDNTLPDSIRDCLKEIPAIKEKP